MSEQLMYNEAEIALIKELFAENDYLLNKLRLLFFGQILSEADKDLIKSTFEREEAKRVLMRKIYGLEDFSTPIGQLSDFWMGAESQVFGATKDTVKQAVESKQRILAMFKQCKALLSDPDGEKPNIAIPEVIDDLGIDLIVRNLFMKSIENALFTISIIAGQKSESVEETVKRLKKNSTR